MNVLNLYSSVCLIVLIVLAVGWNLFLNYADSQDQEEDGTEKFHHSEKRNQPYLIAILHY